MKKIYPANECYCFILRNIASSIKKIYNQHFQELDITNEQFTILMNMKYLAPISVTNLSEKIKIDRTTLSRNLKILQTKALIEDVLTTGRSRQIILSKKGEDIINKGEKIWNKIQKEVEKVIGKEKLETLKEVEKILENY
ncbi:MarR family winged helix-turn-helix transcriptional regulator [Fusobacterium pseudoperiodonticum]|jgi:predicted transcriptional regulator, marR family|nr:MarR family winged helix-turn-helix transcriptional regulator [Fusobacterium pseudoperiodonticum]